MTTNKIFACLGDSITRGFASANYIELLGQLKPEFEFRNFGVNGDLAGDAAIRASEILDPYLSGVVIMLGTNDVRYAFGKAKAKRPTQINASATSFKINIEKIVTFLSENSKAEIIVVGIPLVDESLESGIESLVVEFNEILRNICSRKRLKFVDVRSAMITELEKSKRGQSRAYSDRKISMYIALVLRYVVRLNWNKISGFRKSHFHTDFVHLNVRAAKIIAANIAAAI